MASTFTAPLGFEKQGFNENNDSWGTLLNNTLDLVADAIAGVVSFTLSGSKTLTNTNGAEDESRKAVLYITGGTGGTINIPAQEKVYIVVNGSTGSVVIDPVGVGSTVTIPASEHTMIFCDGTNVVRVNNRDTWRLIDSATTTSGGSADVSLDTSFYQDFRLVIKGVSHNDASNRDLQISFETSTPGTFSTAQNLLTGVSAAQTVQGIYDIGYIGGGLGRVRGISSSSTLAAAQAMITGTTAEYLLYWADTDVRLTWTGPGIGFDAGSVELWAR